MNGPSTAKMFHKKLHIAGGGFLRCSCGGDLDSVKASRPSVVGATSEPTIRRRRECAKCCEKSTTIEVSENVFLAFREETLKEIAVRIIAGEIR